MVIFIYGLEQQKSRALQILFCAELNAQHPIPTLRPDSVTNLDIYCSRTDVSLLFIVTAFRRSYSVNHSSV